VYSCVVDCIISAGNATNSLHSKQNYMLQHLQVLQEEFQVMPNGTKRARDVPVAEKMKGGEAWKDAAIRAVKEELGSVLPVAPQVTSF